MGADIWWRWGLKQSCSPHQELSNSMSHATCTQGNWGDFWLLVLKNQIGKLILGLSFSHTLWFKCPNGSCKHISNIYVSKVFQSYKEFFNPMGFNPYNRSLKIWESIGTPTPKVKIHLGVWGFIPSHSPTLPRAWDVTPGLPSWHATLQALALVMSPKLRLWQNCYVIFLCVQMWNVWSQLGTYVPLSMECTFPCANMKCAFLIGMYTFLYGCMIVDNLIGKWTNNSPNVSPWSPRFQWEHQKFPIWECPMCELIFPQFPTMGMCSCVGIHIFKSEKMFCKCHTCAKPFPPIHKCH